MSEGEKLDITDWGLTRSLRRHGRMEQEAIAWADLTRIDIMTTDAGPLAEDMFFVLHSAHRALVVPNGLAVEAGLLIALQERLAGLDNETVIAASARVTTARVKIWERRRT